MSVTVQKTGVERLREALERMPAESTVPPTGGRIGAVLALFAPAADGGLEVVLTRRRDDLPQHPGQVSFPGGRLDPGETVEEAALREAAEEVALRPETVEVLGRLPAFYIPPSRFWMQVVVGLWREPHPLTAAEREVAEVLKVPVSALRQEHSWRAVDLSSGGHTWAWQLDERHLLWGATAVAMTALLGILEPGWHGGKEPGDLPPERQMRPWEERVDGVVPRTGPALIPGLPEVPASDLPASGNGAGRPTAGRLRAAGTAAAEVVQELLARRRDPRTSTVVVLTGPGGKGAAGLEAVARLAAEGVDVQVVTDRPPQQFPSLVGERLEGLEQRTGMFVDELPEAAVVIDALVGSGLEGPLDGQPHDLVMGLRHHLVPVVSLDVPTGLHPDEGLIGDCVTADLTLAFERPCAGLFHKGLGPFVGDLYLADLEGGPLVRVVPGPDRQRWAE